MRKGEKATTVVFWKFANNAGESQDDGRRNRRQSDRVCCSLAAIPCSMRPRWMATIRLPTMTPPCPSASHTLKRSLQASGPIVRHGGNQAFYSPAIGSHSDAAIRSIPRERFLLFDSGPRTHPLDRKRGPLRSRS